MRRALCLILMAIILPCLSPGIQPEGVWADPGQEVQRMSFSFYPGMDSIKLKWKKQNKVSFYRVYRVDLKGARTQTPGMALYKKVGKVSGNKSAWTDKRVKKNHCYGYVVRGFRKSKGQKEVLVCDSFMEDDCDYACPNLDKPEVLNGGSGEFFTNSKNVLYLYVQRDSGVRPDGVVIYRKTAKGSKYRKIKVHQAEKGRFDQGMAYADKTVKPGTVYDYRARTYKKYKGKRRYSSYSAPVTMAAVNFNGAFDVKSLTGQGDVESFVVKLTSNRNNGALVIRAVKGEGAPVYTRGAGGKAYDDQMVELTAYSADNKHWRKVPSAGVRIEAGEACYLRFAFQEGKGYFAGNAGDYSNLNLDNGVRYESSSGLSLGSLAMELVKGKARTIFDFD